MWYFQFHVTPKPETTEYGIYGGAFVNCWINSSDKIKAETVARAKITQQLWNIENVEESLEVTEETYSENLDGLKYYQEALESGLCLSFHTYPIEKSKIN